MSDAAKPRTVRHMLNFAQRTALADYLRAHYVASGLYDPGAARAATAALGFNVTDSNVAGMRQQLKMAPNRQRTAKPKPTTAGASIVARLAAVEAALADLLHKLGEA